jgi:ribokinase
MNVRILWRQEGCGTMTRSPAYFTHRMILVAGSANLDFVVRARHIPAPGETVLGRDFKTFPGGKGANQAVACARAGGAATHMLLALGEDAFALPLEQSLYSAGVVLHIVRTQQEPTGTAFICVSDDAENAITVAPGANLALRPAHWPALPGISHLLLQLETPMASVVAYAQAARGSGVKVLLNAAPAQPLPGELLEALDLLIVNQGELALLAGADGSIAQQLERLHVPTVVVTLGQRGCLAFTGGAPLFQLAFAIEPVDSTGAGDTFCGVFAAALSQGLELAPAMRRANAAAALACTRMGAQSSIPERAEVDALLARQRPDDLEKLAALRAFCGFADVR